MSEQHHSKASLQLTSCRRAATRSLGRALLAALAGLCATVAVAGEARASIFANYTKWPATSLGYTVIPVCYEPDSSTTQKADGAGAGLIHDPNPDLDAVIVHVRKALARSWEKDSSVRFIGWRSCEDLSGAEQNKALRIFIHPDVDNSTFGLGTEVKGDDYGVNFKPWGNSFNRCISYNASTTHEEYSFACVEQYAIHEFGHALGFADEFTHPLVSSSCEFEDPISANDWTFPYPNNNVYTLFNPDSYDWDSIMAYGDGCVHKTGVRFGSTTLDSIDEDARSIVYEEPAAGTYDVGVMATTAGCGEHEPIRIFMDDEDDSNDTRMSGWYGASRADTGNTSLAFCRVDGSQLAKIAPSAAGGRDGDYAVLKLGAACPSGSVEFSRLIDNEDHANDSYTEGNSWPTVQNANGTTGTDLHFCLFRPENSGGSTMTSFPSFGLAKYGVLAADNFTKGINYGIIHTDDENHNNANTYTTPSSTVLSAAKLIVEGGANTIFHLARVL